MKDDLSSQSKPNEGSEIMLIADHLLCKMNKMESENPFLLNEVSYLHFRMGILSEHEDPSDNVEFLETIYAQLIGFLRGVEANRNSLKVIGKGQHFRLSSYLPAEFSSLRSGFKDVYGPELIEDGIESLAEELLFGAMEGGLDEVPLAYRIKVKKKVMDLLVYDDFEKAAIEDKLEKVGDDELFRLIRLDDSSLETILKTERSIFADICHVILAARDQIHHEYGRPSTMTHAEDDYGLAEISAAARPRRHLKLVE